MDDAPPAPARRGAYAKGVARRQEILARAIEVFAAKGSERTSLRAIAEAIGVSHAALLHYFSSREELLVEVLRERENRYRAEDSERDQTEIVGIMVEAAHRNAAVPGLVSLYSNMLAASLEEGKDYSREYFSTRFEVLRAKLIARIQAGQAAGTVRTDLDPQAVAALVIAASDGLQSQWLLDPAIDIEKSLALLDRLLEK
jgi:TetR/AcrR family transcriptional regulator, transcriptional repressor of aconitase